MAVQVMGSTVVADGMEPWLYTCGPGKISNHMDLSAIWELLHMSIDNHFSISLAKASAIISLSSARVLHM